MGKSVKNADAVNVSWMPEKDQKLTTKSKALLSIATDPTATDPERASAARKAADALREVTSYMLHPEATQAIETQIRSALAAPQPAATV